MEKGAIEEWQLQDEGEFKMDKEFESELEREG